MMTMMIMMMLMMMMWKDDADGALDRWSCFVVVIVVVAAEDQFCRSVFMVMKVLQA